MPTIGPDMTFHRSEAIGVIRDAIAAYRRQIITDLPGQDAIYQNKRSEAEAYIAAGRPTDLTPYPMLAAETGITAPTASELADLWIVLNTQWVQLAAALEAVRLSATAEVGAATTRAEIDAALTAFNTQLNALQGA